MFHFWLVTKMELFGRDHAPTVITVEFVWEGVSRFQRKSIPTKSEEHTIERAYDSLKLPGKPLMIDVLVIS